MEEITALFSICLLTGVGWVAAKLCFRKIISDENCIYFAPALGAAICGLVAYIAVHSYQPSLISVFCMVVAIIAIIFRKRLHSTAWRREGGSAAPRAMTEWTAAQPISSSVGAFDPPDAWRLLRFTALTFLALYIMQIVLYGLFSRLYPGPHEVWSLFNMTGGPPPDQMFAWHQAMFADQHRQYPQAPFLADMDLYDRPHLGGYITLFFFKLFRLPLTEDHFVYPPDGLHFYHCLWWLLNNLYIVGIAPLFRRLFGYRAAILAVATTALGGFFFISAAASWMKFAAGYPFLLAILLYLENQGPALQAALCAVSYYIHGSVLPFLAGFGLLQVLNVRWPIRGIKLPARPVAIFAVTGMVLVGAWFVVVRWVGSKQPLVYYYLYGAGLTEAQTKPVAELAKAFYDKHTWQSLSFFPLHNLLASWHPFGLLQYLKAWLTGAAPLTLSGLANMLFASQRFCSECALALVAAPIVIAGLFKTLAQQHAGKTALCLYLIPTLIVAVVYRIEWAFSLHILILYQALCLFLWITVLGSARTRSIMLALGFVALEGMVCVLFADIRLLPANGLRLGQIPAAQLGWLVAYLAMIIAILSGAAWELRKIPVAPGSVADRTAGRWSIIRIAGIKIAAGLAIIAVVIGLYSIYCLQFYPR
jgi:hypothetical protein